MAYEGCTAETLKGALREMGWDQKHLAERLAVTEETVSRWVRGHLETPQYVWAYLVFAHALRDTGERAMALVARHAMKGLPCPECGQPVRPPPKSNAERQRAWRERRKSDG